MSRDDGFPIADIDVGLLRDLKLRRLRNALDEADANRATVLYLAIIVSSWEDGFRLAAGEADSPIPATPELCAALHEADLLDVDGRIPPSAWESWFRPAWERRQKKREAANQTNRRRWSHSDSQGDSPSESPSAPSVPNRRSVPTTRATNGTNERKAPTPFAPRSSTACGRCDATFGPEHRLSLTVRDPEGNLVEYCEDCASTLQDATA